jgi:hypothetical protein
LCLVFCVQPATLHKLAICETIWRSGETGTVRSASRAPCRCQDKVCSKRSAAATSTGGLCSGVTSYPLALRPEDPHTHRRRRWTQQLPHDSSQPMQAWSRERRRSCPLIAPSSLDDCSKKDSSACAPWQACARGIVCIDFPSVINPTVHPSSEACFVTQLAPWPIPWTSVYRTRGFYFVCDSLRDSRVTVLEPPRDHLRDCVQDHL